MKLLVFIVILFFPLATFSQADLIEKYKNRYYYQGKTYKQNELSKIYVLYPESFDLYIRGGKEVTLANIIAVASLPIIFGGVVGLTSDAENKTFAKICLAGGVLLELIAIYPRVKGNRKLKDALELFNFEMIERHGFKQSTSLSFGFNQYGLGLTFSF